MKKIILALVLSASSATIVFAQADVILVQAEASQQLTNEEHLITSIIQNYHTTLQSVLNDKEQNVESINRLLDKNFTSSQYTIDLNGGQTRINASLKGFNKQLEGLKKVKDLQLNFEIERFNFVRIFEGFAVINYSVVISATLESKSIIRYKGIATTYLFRDADDQWLIMESNGVNAIKNQELGICPCTITKINKDDNKYEVNILYPSGGSLQVETIPFEFNQGLITSNDNVYTMESNMLVTLVKTKGNNVRNQLGNASTKPEAINLALSEHLFKGKCTDYIPYTKVN